MRLKQLDICGFKSFPDKTSISFPQGVCAIVGPNGCGKSNIVDAISWVTGEQSVKQLRGKAMEDVIFAGANGRSPINMAEVSILFKNDNGSAPEEYRDFSEIMVTRRLFRSGESGYFINKRPCRLKDVQHLMLGSGVGARTYSVIQQGNIGAITEAGPEERRVHIEEAAGVTRYKARKKEAEARIESTRQNLLRVMDIISEVERNLSGLKRQAAKAERHKAISGRLFSMEIALAAHEFDAHSKKLSETDSLIVELSDEDIQSSARIAALGAGLEEARARRMETQGLLADLEATHHGHQRNLDRLENALSADKVERARLSNESEKLFQEMEELKKKQEKISLEEAEVRAKQEETQKAHDSAKSLAAEKDAALNAARGELSYVNQAVDGIRTRYTDLVAEETRCRNNLSNASRTKQEIARQIRQKSEESAQAEKKAAESRKKSESAREAVARLKAEIAENEAAITETEAGAEANRNELRETVKFANTLDLALQKMKSRLSTLKRMEANHEWYQEGVRHLLKLRDEARKKGEPDSSHGVLALLAEILSPEEGFEEAVEAALGPALQYVVTPDPSFALALGTNLPEKVSGRVGFVPLSWAGPFSEQAEIPDDSLLNRVKVAEGYHDVAARFLGHVKAAPDGQSAVNLREASPGATVVAQDGSVTANACAILAGKRDSQGPGILHQRNEIRTVAVEMEAAVAELNETRARQAGLEGVVRTLETELQKLLQARKNLGRSESEAGRELVRLEEETRLAERRREIVTLELDQLTGDEDDASRELEKFQELFDRLAAETAALKTELEENSQNSSSLAALVNILQQELMDARLAATAASARLDNQKDTLNRLSGYAAEGARRLVQLEYDAKRKERLADEAEIRIQKAEDELAAAYAEFSALTGALEKERNRMSESEEGLAQAEAALASVESDRKALSEKLSAVKLARAERELRREAVTRRVLERFSQPLEILRQNSEILDLAETGARAAAEAEVTELREKLARMGEVNSEAIEEYRQQNERCDFLMQQRDDLISAIDSLEKVIKKINRFTQERFMETFARVNEKLGEVIPRLFTGGSGQLVLSEPDKPLETGVEYLIQPPGKKVTRMSLLSGGEKALAAIAFVFAIFLIKPSSFCLMDEVDAPLDDANVYRFNQLLKLIGEQSQVIMITHNKNAMEFADVLFGVTMESKGVSKLVSVNLS